MNCRLENSRTSHRLPSLFCLTVLGALALGAANTHAAGGARGGGGGGGGGKMAQSSVSGANRSAGGGGGGNAAKANRGNNGGNANNAGSRNGNNNVSGKNSNNNVNVNNKNVNNVNVNKNVNVNVDNNGYHNDGWGHYDNDYHPIAAGVVVGAVAATTAAVIGSAYSTLPSGCSPVVKNGVQYNYCGSVYYQQTMQGDDVVYVAVNP
jgi:hypothetical protein